MKTTADYIAQLYDHITYLTRRVETTDFAIVTIMGVLEQEHPELAQPFKVIRDAWKADLDKLKEM